MCTVIDISYLQGHFDFERNIPDEYLQKLNDYTKRCTEKLNLEEMRKNIPHTLLNQLFDIGYNDSYFLKSMQLQTIDIILNKALTFQCLITKKILKSQKCFYYLLKVMEYGAMEYDDMSVYYFENETHPFFVGISNGSNHQVLSTQVLFIYYPEQKHIYRVRSFAGLHEESIEDTCINIQKYFLNNDISTTNFISSMFGYCYNIGHTYWNDLSGFKFLLDMGLLPHIDQFIIGPYDYYNVYDYLKKNNFNVIRENEMKNISGILQNKSLLVKFDDWFMYEELKEWTLLNNKLEVECQNEEIKKIKATHYPIITINIRGVFRYLLQQEKVFAHILNELYNIYPNMFILIDGFVTSTNTDLSSYKNEGVRANADIFSTAYQTILDDLLGNMKCPNYKSLIFQNLASQLAWLNISDYGVMQLGAGAFNHVWLMNKKALFIGRNPICNDELLGHTYHDFYYRENRDFTTYINPNIVDFTVTHTKGGFSIDWRVLFYYTYRDLLILEKENFNLSQYENFVKYNIYQSWGIPQISMEELLTYEVCVGAKKLKSVIESL